MISVYRVLYDFSISKTSIGSLYTYYIFALTKLECICSSKVLELNYTLARCTCRDYRYKDKENLVLINEEDLIF